MNETLKQMAQGSSGGSLPQDELKSSKIND